MDFIISQHALEQMIRRGVDHETVLSVISRPDYTVVDDENPEIIIYQSLIEEKGRLLLLRIFVNIDKQPNVIVTLYKTSKISKYHENKVRQ